MRQPIGRWSETWQCGAKDNNLSLNVNKTKELIGDYRKRRAEQAAIKINRAEMEQVEIFKFHGVHITNELSWSKHTKTVVKRARQRLFPLKRKALKIAKDCSHPRHRLFSLLPHNKR